MDVHVGRFRLVQPVIEGIGPHHGDQIAHVVSAQFVNRNGFTGSEFSKRLHLRPLRLRHDEKRAARAQYVGIGKSDRRLLKERLADPCQRPNDVIPVELGKLRRGAARRVIARLILPLEYDGFAVFGQGISCGRTGNASANNEEIAGFRHSAGRGAVSLSSAGAPRCFSSTPTNRPSRGGTIASVRRADKDRPPMTTDPSPR